MVSCSSNYSEEDSKEDCEKGKHKHGYPRIFSFRRDLKVLAPFDKIGVSCDARLRQLASGRGGGGGGKGLMNQIFS